MASRPVLVQLGLFGQPGVVLDHHVVSAHMRVLQDGTEVFVAEHLRWNRPSQPRRGLAPRPLRTHATDAQGDLFAPRAARDAHEMEEIELWPGAWQLPLWSRSSR
ncbi:MAG: hypothetical protein KC656_20525 [Myxococcales bacterium]|nr:hypothetical protein [Myxococcales bacterium]MCB9671231.1 hypothetical protein [Alphaproteobacteria bacterium]